VTTSTKTAAGVIRRLDLRCKEEEVVRKSHFDCPR
jgi:hypothetical protein